MNAINTRDFAVWSGDWDNIMKGAIREDAFLSHRELILAQAGQYQSIRSGPNAQQES